MLCAGGRAKAMEPLTREVGKIWFQWFNDWEKYRSIGVSGDRNGELGQGWRKNKLVVEGRDFYKEAGKEWMLGWEKEYDVDPFLGDPTLT